MKTEEQMKKRGFFCAAVLAAAAALAILVTGCQTTGHEENMQMNRNGKRGILVVSFGTTFAETRKVTIEACEEKIAAAYPDYEVRRAFTSHIVIDALADRDDIHVMKTGEALHAMYEDGFSEVIIQPLHILAGEEFHEKVVKEAARFTGAFEKLSIGAPILASAEDYFAVVEAVREITAGLEEGSALVFMGHGTHHPANASYAALQHMFTAEGMPVYMGTVEGYPTLDDVIAMLKRDSVTKVKLMPFMLVAGDHASNDMAGDEEDSWKSILNVQGFEVSYELKGLEKTLLSGKCMFGMPERQ